jgi:hypothetical protein
MDKYKSNMKKIGEDGPYVDIYHQDLADDTFVHFTPIDRAREIIKGGKLLMDSPYQKFGTDTVNAVSFTYGTHKPNVQTSHINLDDGNELVGIVFKTDTMPKFGFPEEVVWKTDVNLINPKIVSVDEAISKLNKFTPDVDEDNYPKDYQVYYEMPTGITEACAMNKYKNFLRQLRTTENSAIVDSISSAYHMIFESVNYPDGFNIDEFSKLPSFAARKRYAAERLKKLGEGSSRIVYQIDNDTVLKMAKNKKGLAQNEVETDWGMHQMYSELLPDLIDADDDNLWMVKQRANRIKKSEFERMTGFKFNEFGTALRLRVDEIMGRSRHATPEEYQDIIDDEFVGDVISLIVDFDLEPGDMAQIGNWGKLSDEGDPVLTDVGLNRSVWKEHYRG